MQMRRAAVFALALWPLGAQAQDAGTQVTTPPARCIDQITGAEYAAPTMRYAHGVLGDAIEYGTLRVTTRGSCGKGQAEAVLPDNMVFEDLTPRLWDVTGDGKPEVVTIESAQTKGARLSVWGVGDKGFTRLTAAPFIGRTNRWLAPIGAADLDGDGHIELAYIDRPHLAKLLRVWRFKEGQLELVAERDGLTNHRIGQDFISGGLRDCGQGPELITASADWSRVMATTLSNGKLTPRDIGPHKGQSSFNAALACK